MRLRKADHLKHPWVVHGLLHDLRIEDVWKLPVEMHKDQTIEELNEVFAKAVEETANKGLAGWLFKFRFWLGRVFGWESEGAKPESLPAGSIRARYAIQAGLTADDFKPGLPGHFIPVYSLGTESLSEIENATVFAAIHFSKAPLSNDKFTVHMTVYVKPKGWFGAFYMQLIKPFRLWVVYPAMLNMIGKKWKAHQREGALD